MLAARCAIVVWRRGVRYARQHHRHENRNREALHVNSVNAISARQLHKHDQDF